jgi:zinc transport system substrate-binding protein
MKRAIKVLMAALVTAGLGCAPEAPAPEVAEPLEPSSLGTVEVTNEPMAWVVDRLAGPLVEVRFRAADATDPAYWEPTTEDVLAMQESNLIVLNGAAYESWLKDVSLPTSRLVDTTSAVRDRLIEVAGTVTHSHGPEGEHEHTGTAFTTWLDPTLLVEQSRAVEAALAARWPEHAARFAEAFSAVAADLEALDAELAAATAAVGDGPLVFSHPVYQYLERRYGLEGDSVHFEPDVMPDADQWAELDHLLGHGAVQWMIWEAEPIDEIQSALSERGVGVIVVAPCATPQAEGDFLDVMRANAARLRTAFEGQNEP